MYLVTLGIAYYCSGTAYLLSQVPAVAWVALGLCLLRGGDCHLLWVIIDTHPAPAGPWQLMEPSAAQLAAAVITLIFTLIARESDPHGLIKLIKELSFAR